MDEEWTWGDERRPEYERRWIVTRVDDDIIGSSPSTPIRQGYLGIPSGMRVRISGTGKDRTAEMTVKTGRGVSRMEHPAAISLSAAGLAIDASPYRISKRRYFRDGWEINLYKDNLEGLILVERELDTPDREIELPPWMHDAIEVTDTVCDELLARLAYDFDGSPGAEILRGMLTRRLPRVVLTGGPCSGKSTAMRRLTEDFPGMFHCVPDVRGIVIAEIGIPHPTEDRAALRRYNRALGDIQRSVETIAAHQALIDGRRAILLDRGTMDGAAYLPGGVPELADIYMSTAAAEYARYDAVIDITVPSAEVYRRRVADNLARHGSYDDVVTIARRMILAWGGHPDHVIVRDYPTWEEKYAAIRDEVMRAVGL